jgi:hypothetical protein
MVMSLKVRGVEPRAMVCMPVELIVYVLVFCATDLGKATRRCRTGRIARGTFIVTHVILQRLVFHITPPTWLAVISLNFYQNYDSTYGEILR